MDLLVHLPLSCEFLQRGVLGSSPRKVVNHLLKSLTHKVGRNFKSYSAQLLTITEKPIHPLNTSLPKICPIEIHKLNFLVNGFYGCTVNAAKLSFSASENVINQKGYCIFRILKSTKCIKVLGTEHSFKSGGPFKFIRPFKSRVCYSFAMNI